MGVGKNTKAVENNGRWRVPSLVTSAILIVAIATGGALVGLQRLHAANEGGGTTKTPTTTQPPPPLTITSVSPAPGTADAAFDTSVTVDFSQPLASDSPFPTLSPAPPGNWVRSAPSAVRFVPDGYFTPFTTVQLSVPGGPGGVRDDLGQSLSSTLRKKFVIEGASELRLQQLLAELGYLPLKFVPAIRPRSAPARPSVSRPRSDSRTRPRPTDSTPSPPPAIDSEPTDPARIPVQPVAGDLVWRFSDTPGSLRALWTPGQANVITKGAVMAFESAHGLVTDGIPGPKVWTAILQAVALRQVTTEPYDYVSVSENRPETATVWRDGQDIFSTVVNTGIAVAPTALGTYPVYARYLVTTMTGKNPNGTPYSDPGIPWVSYFNGGDALHGFIRAQYGFPQSLGCVEMPYAEAETMYPLTPLGTLVTIA